MKYLIGFLFYLCVHTSYAKDALIKDCAHLQDTTKADFVLLSKKEFIQLGECLAVSYLKKKVEINLLESCNEVDEDRRNFLGIFSLSKLEAIQIGQCLGVINFIHQHYDNEPIPYKRNRYNRRGVYHCTKGNKAIDLIKNNYTEYSSRSELRDLLCREN